MITFNKKTFIYLLLIICLFLLITNAHAADSAANQVEVSLIRILSNKIESITNDWHKNLKKAAFSLFYGLVAITTTYQLIKMAVKGADFNEILLELVKMVLTFGLWIYVIENANEITKDIMDSFSTATNIASNVQAEKVTPSDIINKGLKLANKIIAQSGIIDSVIYGLLALCVLIGYMMIAATLLLVNIETYIITGAGILVLGFAGSPWTSDIAKKYFFSVLATGVKLFITIIVIHFGNELIGILENTTEPSYQKAMAIVGVIFLVGYLSNRVPAMTQAIISGTTSGASMADTVGIAASVGAVASSGSVSAAGSAAGIFQAGKSAISDMKGAASMTGSAANGATGIANAVGGASTGSIGKDNDKSAIPEVSKLKDYAGKAGKAAEFLGRTAANYAKGSVAATAENITKPQNQRSAFDIARKIKEQSMTKKIDGEL